MNLDIKYKFNGLKLIKLIIDINTSFKYKFK